MKTLRALRDFIELELPEFTILEAGNEKCSGQIIRLGHSHIRADACCNLWQDLLNIIGWAVKIEELDISETNRR